MKTQKLRDTKVDGIIKYAQEQQIVLINTVVIVISLISLLLITIVLYII
jgi:hypothetical protein